MTDQKELIPMRPGDILRYQREQEGLTVERAAERSRIQPSIIHAIETGETGDIPSVYLRGYIRNYARFLGVDLEDISEFMDTVRGSEPELKSVFTGSQSRPASERWIKASSYVAASVLIGVLAWQVTHEALRFSQGEAAKIPPAEGLSQSAAPASQNRHMNASIASVEMLEQRSELRSPAQQAWSALSGQPAPENAAATGDHSLSLRTSADTWIEIIDGEGRQLEQDLVRADNTRLYEGQPPFRVMVGRASAVLLEMDGESIDLAPYTRGNVARLTLGETLVAENELPADESETELK